MALTEDERLRYARMIAVPEINTEGMERIRNGKVFVLGCGALGSLVSMYLTGSGVGEIAIADFDTVDISNLQRQLFYKESECGKKKVELLHQRMKELNSTVKINAIDVFVRNENVSDLISDYDLVIDATEAA